MMSDHSLATCSALIDPARVVDQVVVADIAPSAFHRMVPVDGPNYGRRVDAAIIRDRMMHDQCTHVAILGCPCHPAFVSTPLRAGDDRGHASGPEFGLCEATGLWPRAGVCKRGTDVAQCGARAAGRGDHGDAVLQVLRLSEHELGAQQPCVVRVVRLAFLHVPRAPRHVIQARARLHRDR